MSNKCKLSNEEKLLKYKELCVELNRKASYKEICDNLHIEPRTLTKYVKKIGYDSLVDYCCKNDIIVKYAIKVKNTYKLANDIILDDLKTLYKEFYKKHNKIPTAQESIIVNNLPTRSVVTKILRKNNMTLNDLYNDLGFVINNKINKHDSEKYNFYIEKFKNKCEELNRVIKYKDLDNNEWGLPSARWFVKHCPLKIDSYEDFLMYCGFRNRNNLSKKEVIELIYQKQDKLGRPLMYEDFINPKENFDITLTQIRKYWGSLNKMKKELGLKITQENMGIKHKSKQEMLSDLKRLVNEINDVPACKDVDNCPYTLSSNCYARYFGGIGNALKILGYTPNKKSIALNLSNQEMKEIYKEYIDDLGFTPSYEMCKKVYELPSPRTVIRRLNCSWNDFLITLGYDINEEAKGKICFAKDGTRCLSSFECLIHNYLLDKKVLNLNKEVLYRDILHNKQLKQEAGFKRCDWTFVCNDKLYIVEYFGLMTRLDYKERHDFKIDLIKRDSQLDNFIAIYPKDIKHLDEIFKNKLNNNTKEVI